MEATLMFLVRDNEVLLAMKKRGFGVGMWNGAGGKLEPGETPSQAAKRECQEEILVTPLAYHKAAQFEFTAYMNGKKITYPVHAYVCSEWEGEPTETEEMRPQWFGFDEIPFDNMWADDRFWLPKVLDGKKLVGVCTFGRDNVMLTHEFNLVETFDDE